MTDDLKRAAEIDAVARQLVCGEPWLDVMFECRGGVLRGRFIDQEVA